jgi:hypothetical protein
MWPAIAHTIEINEAKTEDLKERGDRFLQDLASLFDKIQDKFENLPEDYQRICGQSGIAVDIDLKIDTGKKEIILDRLYKYCEIDVHLFRDLIGILQNNFPEYSLIVPSLEGYQLAEEIYKHLGEANIECIYLKGEEEERLLMGDILQDISFEAILENTRQHYLERGGIGRKEKMTRCGGEISMYCRVDESEDEVLWMQIRVPVQSGRPRRQKAEARIDHGDYC